MDESRESESSSILKVLIIGNSLVGKSCILLRFCDNEFVEDIGTTIGVDFRFASLTIQEEPVKLQIWDTAGQERFRTITSTYYRNADAIMIVYDITDKDSFAQVKNWFREISNNAPSNVTTILVGNKIDLENKRVISSDEGKSLAKSLRSPFIEVSAKMGDNIETAFSALTVEALKKIKPSRRRRKTTLVQFSTQPKKKCC
ncbi:ras and ef-hand domain-containing protein [Anaeramoeba ignava]|uniref:Ras and ef-hand domain-containing protein n=1 Tax=Anaeramoeba ignava TaxID=1746090 RepID=A0A9Q0L982_ANAIG|nr:ras and ef-hand domain-containing protein [Anaeramoeba ignava]